MRAAITSMAFDNQDAFLYHLSNEVEWAAEEAAKRLEKKDLKGCAEGVMLKNALQTLYFYEQKGGCCPYHEAIAAANRKEYCKN